MRWVVSVYAWFFYSFVLAWTSASAALRHRLWRTSDPRSERLHRFVGRRAPWLLRAWPGWKVQVLHRTRLPEGAAVLVANHQSMVDILACYLLDTQFKFVSKASLFELPLLGGLMRRLGYVALERGRVRSTASMLKACRSLLQQGIAVLIFPEGTYGAEELLPFKRGPFQLAMELLVPVVPVVLHGTQDLIDGDGPFFGTKANISIEVLPPLRPADFPSDPDALAQIVRSQMEKALSEER